MASFTVQFVVFGIQNSYGILFVSLMEEFNSSELVTGKHFVELRVLAIIQVTFEKI